MADLEQPFSTTPEAIGAALADLSNAAAQPALAEGLVFGSSGSFSPTKGFATISAAPGSIVTVSGAPGNNVAYGPLGAVHVKNSEHGVQVFGEASLYEKETLEYCANCGIVGRAEIQTIDNLVKMLKGFPDAAGWNGQKWTALKTDHYHSSAGIWIGLRKLSAGAGNVVYDLSKAGKNLAIFGQNVTWADDGMPLDGTNDRLVSSAPVITADQWAVMLVGEKTSWSEASRCALVSQSDDATEDRVNFIGCDTAFQAEVWAGEDTPTVTSMVGPRGFFGLMSVRNATAQRIYSHGLSSPVAETAASPLTPLAANFGIGGAADASALFVDFKFSFCAAWNSALPEADYAALYANVRSILGLNKLADSANAYPAAVNFCARSGIANPIEFARADNVIRMLYGQSCSNSINGAYWETITSMMTDCVGAWIMTTFWGSTDRSTIYDATTNANNLTMVGSPTFGQRGLNFNGTSQYLTLPTAAITSGQWACFAMGRSLATSGNRAIAAQNVSGSNNRTTFLGIESSGELSTFRRVDPTSYTVTAGQVAGDFAAAAIQGGSNLQLHQNDSISVAGTTALAPGDILDTPLVIGGNAAGASYVGELFAVFIWSRTQTLANMTKLRRNLNRLLGLDLTLTTP